MGSAPLTTLNICETGGRVSFEPAVALDSLIPLANEADVGVAPIPVSSVHNRYCLPNKVFEYVAAGLCLCVSPAEEMAELVRRYEMGIVTEGDDADAISRAINSLDRDRVARLKASALDAARDLNWARESTRMLALYDELDDQRRATGAPVESE